jgi:hypothetical protein
MENQTLLFYFLIMVFILYIITIKKEDETFTDDIDVIQKRQIQDLKQKLKK